MSNFNECSCTACPGADCQCGCQSAKTEPKTESISGCRCGNACKCGPQCECKAI